MAIGTYQTPCEVVSLKLSGVSTRSSTDDDSTGKAAAANAREVTSKVCGNRMSIEASLMVKNEGAVYM